MAHRVQKPALCAVLQGAKWAAFGVQEMEYRAGQALFVSVDMPTAGGVTEADRAKPFLGLVIELDLAIARDVLEALPAPPPSSKVDRAAFIVDFDGPLAECAYRLVRLLAQPDAISIVAPSIMRELCYWLLTGPQGGAVARLALGDGQSRGLIAAIHELRHRFARPLPIGELARTAGLSVSAFHRRFKACTGMTPLQYQKKLRLLEARRLLAAGAHAESAAYQVGYESPSQFSREYSRLFGAPPRQDVAALRRGAA